MKNNCVILALLCLVSACNTQKPQTIPEFKIVLPDSSKVFNSKEIPYGKNIILIQFDPACRDCQIEMEGILAHIENFKNTNFYLVTGHSYDEMMVFHDHLRLNAYGNIKIGVDKESSIPKQMGIRSTPLTMVYDKNKVLKAVFNGAAKVSDLKKIINS